MAKTIYDDFSSSGDTLNRQNLENRFNQPMPMIGIYIAVASLICTIGITIDTLQSFTRSKLWFPCKYFALNATSLMMIAVSMKLPVDLNNPMYGRLDQLAKFSSTVFACTMLASFMPSLGAMEDLELMMNMLALVIMVITILVNLCIEISTEMIAPAFALLFVVTFWCMLLMLIIMICSALTVSASKKVLELKYREMHREIVGSGNNSDHTRKEKIEKLEDEITKYWLMAITSSPQFVMAGSEACCACGVICLTVDVFLMLSAKSTLAYDNVRNCDSVYKDSIIIILIIQCTGVVLGSVAPIFRLLEAFSFKISCKWSKNYLQVYRIESYWTQRLVQWKQISPLDDLPIGGRVFRKCVHEVKNHVLDFCIVLVTAIAVVSKTIRLLANFFVILVFYCYFGFRIVKRKCMNESSDLAVHNANTFMSQSEPLRRYALQFHDAVELSDRTLNNITIGIKKFVETARKRKPRNLMDLLQKSRDFKGVVDFDNDQVPHLHSEEPPNGWSLPVITLTSIALALPDIQKDDVNRLLNSVKKGLSYVKHVEKTLHCKGDLAAVRKASDVVWRGVELRDMWLKYSLKNKLLKSNESTLQWLSDKAKSIVMEERTSNGDQEISNNWSINVIAANSMYRICETIMLDHQGSEGVTDENLFEKLAKTIADILCACFMNLPRVISIKCYSSAIGQREESVRTAAGLVGETEEILKILSERELPSGLDLHDQMAYIDEWRCSMKLPI